MRHHPGTAPAGARSGSSDGARPSTPRSRRGVVVGCLLGLASGWNVGNIGGITSEVAAVYDVPLAVVGLFTTALYVTHTAIQIPGGRASDRFGPARAGMAALGFIAVGNLLALTAAEPAVALVARAITGLGSGLAFVAGSALVRVAGGSPFDQGMFGGIGLGAGGLAVAVVPLLEDAVGWRAPFWSSLALAAAVGVLLARAGTAAPGATRPAAGRPTGIGRLARDGRLWRIAAFYTASYGLSVVVANWVVELLRRHGDMSGAAAAATGALTLALVVVSRPVGGWILRAHPDRMRSTLAASLVAGSVGTLALVAAQPAWLAVLGATLVGIGAGISFSPAFTWAAVARPDAPAAAVGLVNTVANVVVLAGTPLVGLAFSLPGDGRIGFLVVALLWLAAIPSLAALRATPSGDGLAPAPAAGR